MKPGGSRQGAKTQSFQFPASAHPIKERKVHPDVLLLRALKGAPLSVLLALRCLGRAGIADLTATTGYGHEAVAEGLRGLAGMGFVVQTSRYHARQLTPPGVQLRLFIPAQLEGDSAPEAPAPEAPAPGTPSAPEAPDTAGPERGKSALAVVEEEVLINPETGNLTSTSSASERGKTALQRGKSALAVVEEEVLINPETGNLTSTSSASERVKTALECGKTALEGANPALTEMAAPGRGQGRGPRRRRLRRPWPRRRCAWPRSSSRAAPARATVAASRSRTSN
jgi:hypothetical protein